MYQSDIARDHRRARETAGRRRCRWSAAWRASRSPAAPTCRRPTSCCRCWTTPTASSPTPRGCSWSRCRSTRGRRPCSRETKPAGVLLRRHGAGQRRAQRRHLAAPCSSAARTSSSPTPPPDAHRRRAARPAPRHRSSRCSTASSAPTACPSSPQQLLAAVSHGRPARQPRAGPPARAPAGRRRRRQVRRRARQGRPAASSTSCTSAPTPPACSAAGPPPAKLKLLQYYEQARNLQGGYSVDKYVENFARDFLTQLTLAERRHILAGGEKWPASALSVLARLPDDPGAEVLATDPRPRRPRRPAVRDAATRSAASASASSPSSAPATEPSLAAAPAHDLPERAGVPRPRGDEPGPAPRRRNWPFLVDALRDRRGPDGSGHPHGAGHRAAASQRASALPQRDPRRPAPGRQRRRRGRQPARITGTATTPPSGGRLASRAGRVAAVVRRRNSPTRRPPSSPARRRPRQVELRRAGHVPRQRRRQARRRQPRPAGVRQRPVRPVPPRGLQRRNPRPRPHDGRPALPAQGNPRIDRVPLARHLRPVRQPLGHRQRQNLRRAWWPTQATAA